MTFILPEVGYAYIHISFNRMDPYYGYYYYVYYYYIMGPYYFQSPAQEMDTVHWWLWTTEMPFIGCCCLCL